MMMHGRKSIAGICTMLLFTAASLAGPPQYAVIDLGTLGGTASRASGLNDLGQVTGWSQTAAGGDDRAYYWSPETGMLNLGTLGGTRSLAYDINNAGQVVGQAKLSSGFWRGFMWQLSTGITDLGTPSGTIDSVARALNGSGQAVGFAYPSSGNPRALRRVGNSWQTLPTLGGTYGAGQAINAAGHVVGSAGMAGDALKDAVMWDGGVVNDLGRLPGWSWASGLDINDFDEVVGWSGHNYDMDGHAFRWSGGVMSDLGTLGGSTSRAYAINNAGLVTGASMTASGAQWHAFLYYDDVMYDLNDLVLNAPGWEILDAQDINASGQIVGNVLIGGQIHAYLATPIPEPGALALLAAGAIFVLGRRATPRDS